MKSSPRILIKSSWILFFLFCSAHTFSQCDCLEDNEAPELVEFNENLFLGCDEPFLSFPPVFQDDCDDVQLNCTISQIEEETNCLLTPTHVMLDDKEEAMLIFGLEEVSSSGSFYLTSGTYSFNEDMTNGHFNACLTSEANPDGGYMLDVTIENGLPWEEWSTQEFPTWYRDDLNIAGDNYLDWLYFIASNDSHLTGTGNLEGTFFSLEHAPSSNFYGFQLGIGANNANIEYGSTGWFTFEGNYVLDGEDLGNVDGSVSLFFNHSTCIHDRTEVEWTAMDFCGNSTTATQSITFCNSCISYGCPGDYNSDGTVSAADLLIFINAYFCQFPDDCPEDLDGDGNVNVADLLEFLVLLGNDCH